MKLAFPTIQRKQFTANRYWERKEMRSWSRLLGYFQQAHPLILYNLTPKYQLWSGKLYKLKSNIGREVGTFFQRLAGMEWNAVRFVGRNGWSNVLTDLLMSVRCNISAITFVLTHILGWVFGLVVNWLLLTTTTITDDDDDYYFRHISCFMLLTFSHALGISCFVFAYLIWSVRWIWMWDSLEIILGCYITLWKHVMNLTFSFSLKYRFICNGLFFCAGVERVLFAIEV